MQNQNIDKAICIREGALFRVKIFDTNENECCRYFPISDK